MKASSNPIPVQLEGHHASPEGSVDCLSRESGVFPPEPDSGTHVVPTERWSHLTRDVLDRLAVPVMVLDARARIEFTNEAARTLVARAEGLRRRGAFLEGPLTPRPSAADSDARGLVIVIAGRPERMGISLSTARTHLQRVFDKTGTRRQAQLARLLETNPVMMLADGNDLLAGREP